MKYTCTFLLLFFVFALGNAQNSILGFSEKSANEQQALEKAFEEKLKATNIDNWIQKMSAEPHWVGTKFGEENAKWMRDQFKSWGYDAKIETYHVLFPYPTERVLELTEPTQYKAKLTAVPVEGDPYTAQGDALLPSYNAFSTDGDVEGELVFVNYGIPKDYEELEKLGISVKGKIVIAKYQGSWRGIKPKLAAENGAIGCIIYSDPQDDGYGRGDVYPKGAFKNKTGVQRGSVMDMPTYPGDVLTPGYGATKDAKRLTKEEAPTITKIPVLPISYQDAQPLLEALEGPIAPESWRGGLPITYHIGPGKAKVHLKLKFDWQLVPAHNVIATMKGTEFPDQWVVRGNHHDAWVHGANDPVSGMVALMEEARAVGEMAKKGQKPKRTLVYCAWDAEEPGLIGSTEWVEDHKKELQEKVVAYINTDGNGRGFLGVGGSHSLQSMVSEVAGAVTDPQTKVSVKERRIARDMVNGGNDTFELYALGSGSDYTPFIQHAGIASLNLGFGGENEGGEYHTIYDTYPHYKRFKDPEFAYGVALANTAGRITLRLANADIIPLDFSAWYKTVSGYLEEIMEETAKMRTSVEKHNKLIDRNAFELALDPRENIKAPERKEPVPYLDFSPLQNVLSELKSTIDAYSSIDLHKVSKAEKEKLNALLMDAEHKLTSEDGLPRRPWFKHQIYAPGFYTGYGVKTLPGVREAIEQKNWSEAKEQISVLSGTLSNFNEHLKAIIGTIK
ncbi:MULTISPECIES: transferrin receptor-like dimerization domain-containing protein [Maribacter]|uniref:Transferrin receptor-like dimerization domain-containing protein n=1 Tax=Maribacter flavus TaxID=1658664 RepID=A0ABU7ILJ7_9FLAO|nr:MULTISPECIES: transferrin receptor-like dimerization domain-containing protein [Maribacter]MDC6406720.1 transferrin receptor-like dimerization domain-containing protein [Maribacter sp. PR66]MEE1973838.1 transferrin receptor-like dimerization domain-containing protein [Maribacter flavus]